MRTYTVDWYPFQLDTVQPAVSAVTAVAAELEILAVIVGAAIDSFPSVIHHILMSVINIVLHDHS
jgi:hypothetical protein